MPLGLDAPTAPPVSPTRRFHQASTLRQVIGQTIDYGHFDKEYFIYRQYQVGCGRLCPNTPCWISITSKKGSALSGPVADIMCRARLRL